MAATAVVGLALGASLLYWWSRDQQTGATSHAAAAPTPAPVAPVTPPTSLTELPPVPVGPPAVAAQPAAPAPAPVVAAPEPVAAVAAAPPPAAFASPVEVVALPAPAPAVEPEPVAPALQNDAPPARGEVPPYDFRAREARKTAAATASSATPQAAAAGRASESTRAEAPPARAATTRRQESPPRVARTIVPDVRVSSTVWHPQRDRRIATVTLAGGAPKELHEGDAIGPLVVSLIEPSGVVFVHDGVELRRRVGAKN